MVSRTVALNVPTTRRYTKNAGAIRLHALPLHLRAKTIMFARSF